MNSEIKVYPMLKDWFETIPGTYYWAIRRARDLEIFSIYYRLERWGA